MVEAIGIGVILLGAVLLFFGAALSVYGVALLGILIGGGAGHMLAPTIAGAMGVEGIAALVAPVVVGALAGAALAYTLLSVMIAAAGFVAGGLLGAFVITPLFVEGAFYVEWGAILLAAMAGALFGMVMSKTALVFITSFLGAALASTQLTVADLTTAAEELTVDPLVIETDPVFLGLFALGVLSQFGLFRLGYVTKITALLPGARAIRNRGEGGAEGA